jgi:hypothetical protein
MHDDSSNAGSSESTDRDESTSAATNGGDSSQAETSEPKRLLEITRDEVLSARDTKIIDVPVDEWKKGAVVHVHTPTSDDRDYLEMEILKGGKLDKKGVRAALVCMCVKDANGNRLFEAGDLEALGRKSFIPMDRIYKAIIDASIITEEDVAKLAKNSGAASTDIS